MKKHIHVLLYAHSQTFFFHRKWVLLLFFLLGLLPFTRAQDLYWTGSVSSNWSEAGNWSEDSGGTSSGTIPNSGTSVVFDENGSTACEITTNVTIQGMQIEAGYNSSISHSSGSSIQLFSDFTQEGGTFDAGAVADLSIEGDFEMTGGTFRSTSETFTYEGVAFSVTGGTFQHNNGRMFFNPSAETFVDFDTPTEVMFYDLEVLPNEETNIFFIQGTSILQSENSLILRGGGVRLTGGSTGKIEALGNVMIGSLPGLALPAIEVDLVFSGGKEQTLGFENSGRTDLLRSDIYIDKTAGNVTLTTNLTLEKEDMGGQTLFLTDGNLLTSSGAALILRNNGSVTDGSSESFVDGPMERFISGGQNLFFPVGKDGTYAPIEALNISGMSPGESIEAEYFAEGFHFSTELLSSSSLKNISRQEYWTLNSTSSTGTAEVALHWANGASQGIDNLPDIKVAGLNAFSSFEAWEDKGGIVDGTSTVTTGSVRATTAISFLDFSHFTFASVSSTVNGLGSTIGDACNNSVVLNIGNTNVDFDLQENFGYNGNTSSSLCDIESSDFTTTAWATFVGDGSTVRVLYANNTAESDIKLEVFTSPDCFQFSNVVCANDKNNGEDEQVEFTTTNGQSYIIRILAGSEDGNTDGQLSVFNPPPPDAPQNLTVTSVTANAFTVSWDAVSDDVTSYQLDVATDLNFTEGSFVSGYEDLTVASGTTENVNELTAGTTYYVRVRAVGEYGTSDNSGILSVITVPPTPVTVLPSQASSTGFVARWDAVDGATSYLLDVSSNADFSDNFVVQDKNATLTSSLISVPTPDITYYYRVRAQNPNGISDYSNTQNVLATDDNSNLPTAPSALSVFAVSSTEARLSWRDNADNETGFEVWRTTDIDNLAYELVTTVGENTASGEGNNIVSYTDDDNGNGLLPNTKYYYRVRTLNIEAGLSSSFTLPKSVTTRADLPEAPTDLEGFPISDTQVNLEWLDNSTNETGFRIFRAQDLDPDSFSLLVELEADVTSYEDTSVPASGDFFYIVVAFNSGGESEISNIVTVSTAPVPAAPSNLEVGTVGTQSIDISWTDNASDETGFVIEIASLETDDVFFYDGEASADATAYAISDLDPNTTYEIRVAAYNEFGSSPYSEIVSATTDIDEGVSPPVAPINVLAEPVSTIEASIRWQDISSDETSFRIERAPFTTDPETGEDVLGEFQRIGTVLDGVTNFSDIGLSAGETYAYRIYGVNGGGDSPASEVVVIQAVCNIVSVIKTDLDDNGSVACDTKQILLDLNTNVSLNSGTIQWFKNDQAIDDANIEMYLASETGEYYCLVIAGDCEKKSDIVSVIVNPSFSITIELENSILSTDFSGASQYQWFYNYQAVENATSDSYTPVASGTYYVVVTNDDCSSTSNLYFHNVTGTENYDISSAIHAYPIPTAQKLGIDMEVSALGNYSISLIDVSGTRHLLKQGQKNALQLSQKLDLQQFSKGIYMLEIKIDDYTGFKKIVKY